MLYISSVFLGAREIISGEHVVSLGVNHLSHRYWTRAPWEPRCSIHPELLSENTAGVGVCLFLGVSKNTSSGGSWGDDSMLARRMIS